MLVMRALFFPLARGWARSRFLTPVFLVPAWGAVCQLRASDVCVSDVLRMQEHSLYIPAFLAFASLRGRLRSDRPLSAFWTACTAVCSSSTRILSASRSSLASVSSLSERASFSLTSSSSSSGLCVCERECQYLSTHTHINILSLSLSLTPTL